MFIFSDETINRLYSITPDMKKAIKFKPGEQSFSLVIKAKPSKGNYINTKNALVLLSLKGRDHASLKTFGVFAKVMHSIHSVSVWADPDTEEIYGLLIDFQPIVGYPKVQHSYYFFSNWTDSVSSLIFSYEDANENLVIKTLLQDGNYKSTKRNKKVTLTKTEQNMVAICQTFLFLYRKYDADNIGLMDNVFDDEGEDWF